MLAGRQKVKGGEKMASKPNYRLKILNKDLDTKCNDAGAGWVNSDGSISIVISPGVLLKETIHWEIRLFPIKDKG